MKSGLVTREVFWNSQMYYLGCFGWIIKIFCIMAFMWSTMSFAFFSIEYRKSDEKKQPDLPVSTKDSKAPSAQKDKNKKFSFDTQNFSYTKGGNWILTNNGCGHIASQSMDEGSTAMLYFAPVNYSADIKYCVLNNENETACPSDIWSEAPMDTPPSITRSQNAISIKDPSTKILARYEYQLPNGTTQMCTMEVYLKKWDKKSINSDDNAFIKGVNNQETHILYYKNKPLGNDALPTPSSVVASSAPPSTPVVSANNSSEQIPAFNNGYATPVNTCPPNSRCGQQSFGGGRQHQGLFHGELFRLFR